MNNGHEAHHSGRRPPQQITPPIFKGDVLLAVDGAGSLLQCLFILEERVQGDLLGVNSGPAFSPGSVRNMRGIGDGVGSHAADQVIALVEQPFDDLASGTANTLWAACMRILTACRECPMMYSGLLESDC